jgi:hypothetical protein
MIDSINKKKSWQELAWWTKAALIIGPIASGLGILLGLLHYFR